MAAVLWLLRCSSTRRRAKRRLRAGGPDQGRVGRGLAAVRKGGREEGEREPPRERRGREERLESKLTTSFSF